MMKKSQDRAAFKAGYDKIEWKPVAMPRKAPAESKRGDFPVPMVVRDFPEPVQSMADGKFYGSKAALARSHKAAHNPHGQDFIELGNEKLPEFRPHVTDRKAEREVLRKAMHDVDNGWRPESVAIDL